MFTAFFVLTQYQKKPNRSRFICPISCPIQKITKMGHEKSRKARPIGSLTIVHLAKSGNKK